jgi:DAPG hydrolase PhiG domain
VSSASAGAETLNDGREKYWVKHDVLKNVTPQMLAWWFGHFADGDVEIQGRRFPRYRVWHPLDHVYAHYVRRASDGSGGPGAQIALCEYLGRNPSYKIEGVSTIEKLDDTGFIHQVIKSGVVLARMEHVFTKTEDGTRDENCLIVPGTPRLGPVARLVLRLLFPDEKGQAWLKHSIEEMGYLENFLPELYGRETKHESVIDKALV